MDAVCSMYNCYNTADNSTSIHFFPFPQNFDLCMHWIQNCGNSEFCEDFMYGGTQPFISNKVVCSNHFCKNDFIDPDCVSKGLKEEAVPLFNCNELKPNILREECIDESPDGNIINSEDNSLVKLKEIGFAENQGEMPDLYLNDSEKEQLVDDSYLPLLIVLNDRDVIDSVSQKSQQAFQAAWKRAMESVEERDARNKANALRNASKRARETEEQRKARNLENAFRNAYRRANETEGQRKARNSANASRNTYRRAKETEEQRKDRLYKNAVRTAVRRSMESESKREERQRWNALRAAYRRSIESDEQREQRRLKEKMRSAERRRRETELQSKIRKYNVAVRAAIRRDNETEEEKQQRRSLDARRAACNRSNECLEQRMKRLTTERERATKRRLLKKVDVTDALNNDLKSCLKDLQSMSGTNVQSQTTNDEILRHLSCENGNCYNVRKDFNKFSKTRFSDLSDQNHCK